MTVPDEAVEAAARAFRDTHYMGDSLMAALEAAAPIIAAQAWDEGEEAGIHNYRHAFLIHQVEPRERIANPYRSGM